MARRYIVFPGLITFAQYGVDDVQTAVTILQFRNRARLKLHFRALRQFDRFQWSEHAPLIHRMNRLHATSLPPRWRQCQFLNLMADPNGAHGIEPEAALNLSITWSIAMPVRSIPALQ